MSTILRTDTFFFPGKPITKKKVEPGTGEICKGTDFPGLLRPVEHVLPQGHPQAHLEARAAETAAATKGSKDHGAKDKESSAEEGKKDVAGVVADGSSEGTAVMMEQDGGDDEEEESEDAKRKRAEEEEEAKKREEEEEMTKLIKIGARSLIPVLGEEVADKVSLAAFHPLLCCGSVWATRGSVRLAAFRP